MTAWIVIVTMLAGLNLVRATGRGWIVAAIALAGLAGAGGLGWLAVLDWIPFGVSAGLAAIAVTLWQPWVLHGGPWRMAGGFVAMLAAAAVALLWLGAPPPVLMGTWIWLAAFLFLAEPATRLSLWILSLTGKPRSRLTDTWGRGEAIGVLERWIALIVVAHGEYGALAFLLAAKALARHKRFEDPEFAEYFLVGTLASLLLAIAAAEALGRLGIA